MSAPKKQSIEGVIAARRSKLLARSDSRNLIVRVLLIAGVVYLIFTQAFLLRQVKGMDMFPSLKDGDLSIVFRMQKEYVKNDVITYKTEEGTRFGRIIAREGDVVTINSSGSLQVNGTTQSGEILYPTYPIEGVEDIKYPYRVPQGCVFVLGDYRTKAKDSRTYGPISMDDVDGKVITILRRRGL